MSGYKTYLFVGCSVGNISDRLYKQLPDRQEWSCKHVSATTTTKYCGECGAKVRLIDIPGCQCLVEPFKTDGKYFKFENIITLFQDGDEYHLAIGVFWSGYDNEHAVPIPLPNPSQLEAYERCMLFLGLDSQRFDIEIHYLES